MLLAFVGLGALLIGVGLGFCFGKEVSTWCVRCGNSVHSVNRASDAVGPTTRSWGWRSWS